MTGTVSDERRAREILADYYRSGDMPGMADEVLRDDWRAMSSPAETSLVAAIARGLRTPPQNTDGEAVAPKVFCAMLATGVCDLPAKLAAAEAERDALVRERTNLIETKREQLARLSAERDALARALGPGFMTAVSDGQAARYEVAIKFHDLRSMQAAHNALVRSTLQGDAK